MLGEVGIVGWAVSYWVERRQGGACPTLPLSPFHFFTFFTLLPFYLSSPSHFLTFLSRCFLRVVECHAYGVLGQFGDFAAGEQCADACLVLLDFRLGLEEYVHRLDVLSGGELLYRVGGSCGHADFECAEAVQLDAVRHLQVLLHRFHEFAEHGHYVGALHGAVGLHFFGEVVDVHRSGVYGACVPLALVA